MDFKLIADENIPNSVIKELRNRNFDIFSIRQEKKGIRDEEIIRLSKEMQRPIITMDKDFGYLTFHQNLHPYCIILLRIHPHSSKVVYSSILRVLNLILKQNMDLNNKFIVTDGKTLRIRNF
jgi:predicted nuclease of predicted toxin-antitoxin system